MYWSGVLYALDWWVVCTGLAIPVQYTSPVHNTLYVLSCMYSTGMLYEGGGKGVGHCPAPLLEREGGGEKY